MHQATAPKELIPLYDFTFRLLHNNTSVKLPIALYTACLASETVRMKQGTEVKARGCSALAILILVLSSMQWPCEPS